MAMLSDNSKPEIEDADILEPKHDMMLKNMWSRISFKNSGLLPVGNVYSYIRIHVRRVRWRIRDKGFPGRTSCIHFLVHSLKRDVSCGATEMHVAIGWFFLGS